MHPTLGIGIVCIVTACSAVGAGSAASARAGDAFPVAPADILLSDGHVLKSARIITTTPAAAAVLHEGGLVTVGWLRMPEEIRQYYTYDEAAAAAFEATAPYVLPFPADPADITLSDGRILKAARIVATTPAAAAVIYDGKAITVEWELMPVAIQKQYAYDSATADAYEAAEAARARKYSEDEKARREKASTQPAGQVAAAAPASPPPVQTWGTHSPALPPSRLGPGIPDPPRQRPERIVGVATFWGQGDGFRQRLNSQRDDFTRQQMLWHIRSLEDELARTRNELGNIGRKLDEQERRRQLRPLR